MKTSKPTGEIDVAYVANLARIHLSGDEISKLQGQLEQIVAYVEQLNELDVEGIEPTAHAVPVQNVLREDEVRPSLDRERVMQNAPESRGGEILVPRIVE